MKIYKTPNYMLSSIAISPFWFLRGINQVIFYGLTDASTPLWSWHTGWCFSWKAYQAFRLAEPAKP